MRTTIMILLLLGTGSLLGTGCAIAHTHVRTCFQDLEPDLAGAQAELIDERDQGREPDRLLVAVKRRRSSAGS